MIQSELLAKEAETPCQGVYSVTQWLGRPVPPGWLVIEENRMTRDACRLQTGRHFAGMHGIAAGIRIAGDQQNCWISNAILDAMIWRVRLQTREILRIVGRAVFLGPHVRAVKQMIAKHV